MKCTSQARLCRSPLSWPISPSGDLRFFDGFSKLEVTASLPKRPHLSLEQERQAKAGLAGAGLHSFWAGATESNQTKGGLLVATPWQARPRLVRAFTLEGCGFLAVELPGAKWRLVVISVYLKSGTGLHVEPNASLVAELMALTKRLPNWVAAGDWKRRP